MPPTDLTTLSIAELERLRAQALLDFETHFRQCEACQAADDCEAAGELDDHLDILEAELERRSA